MSLSDAADEEKKLLDKLERYVARADHLESSLHRAASARVRKHRYDLASRSAPHDDDHKDDPQTYRQRQQPSPHVSPRARELPRHHTPSTLAIDAAAASSAVTPPAFDAPAVDSPKGREGDLLLRMTVEITSGVTAELEVRIGDAPDEVLSAFCAQHRLGGAAARTLGRALAENLRLAMEERMVERGEGTCSPLPPPSPSPSQSALLDASLFSADVADVMGAPAHESSRPARRRKKRKKKRRQPAFVKRLYLDAAARSERLETQREALRLEVEAKEEASRSHASITVKKLSKEELEAAGARLYAWGRDKRLASEMRRVAEAEGGGVSYSFTPSVCPKTRRLMLSALDRDPFEANYAEAARREDARARKLAQEQVAARDGRVLELSTSSSRARAPTRDGLTVHEALYRVSQKWQANAASKRVDHARRRESPPRRKVPREERRCAFERLTSPSRSMRVAAATETPPRPLSSGSGGRRAVAATSPRRQRSRSSPALPGTPSAEPFETLYNEYFDKRERIGRRQADEKEARRAAEEAAISCKPKMSNYSRQLVERQRHDALCRFHGAMADGERVVSGQVLRSRLDRLPAEIARMLAEPLAAAAADELDAEGFARLAASFLPKGMAGSLLGSRGAQGKAAAMAEAATARVDEGATFRPVINQESARLAGSREQRQARFESRVLERRARAEAEVRPARPRRPARPTTPRRPRTPPPTSEELELERCCTFSPHAGGRPPRPPRWHPSRCRGTVKEIYFRASWSGGIAAGAQLASPRAEPVSRLSGGAVDPLRPGAERLRGPSPTVER